MEEQTDKFAGSCEQSGRFYNEFILSDTHNLHLETEINKKIKDLFFVDEETLKNKNESNTVDVAALMQASVLHFRSQSKILRQCVDEIVKKENKYVFLNFSDIKKISRPIVSDIISIKNKNKKKGIVVLLLNADHLYEYFKKHFEESANKVKTRYEFRFLSAASHTDSEKMHVFVSIFNANNKLTNAIREVFKKYNPIVGSSESLYWYIPGDILKKKVSTKIKHICKKSIKLYKEMLSCGVPPDEAKKILPSFVYPLSNIFIEVPKDEFEKLIKHRKLQAMKKSYMKFLSVPSTQNK